MNNLEDTGTFHTPPRNNDTLDGNLVDNSVATFNEFSNNSKMDSSVQETNQLIDKNKVPKLNHAGTLIESYRFITAQPMIMSNNQSEEHKF